MNKYGAMAESHWRTWLPRRYATIEDPSSFFSELGVQVSDQIATLELDLLGPEVPGEDFLARVGRRNMARLQAEELTLRDLVLLPAETSAEDESDEIPPEWAIPSALETVETVRAAEPPDPTPLPGGGRR
jgi:hypothetical protein